MGHGPYRKRVILHQDFIAEKVFIKAFGKSPFPHKSVNLSFIVTSVKNKLTNCEGIDFCKTTL